MLKEGKYYWVQMTQNSEIEVCRYSDRLFYNTRGQMIYASTAISCVRVPIPKPEHH